jgi:hypothetical protein
MPFICDVYNSVNTLFLFRKKKTCAKRKTMKLFLVEVFTEGKKVVGKAFLSKKRFVYYATPCEI